MIYGSKCNSQTFEDWRSQWEKRAIEIMAQAPIFRVEKLDIHSAFVKIEMTGFNKSEEPEANIKMCELAIRHRYDVKQCWLKICTDQPLPSRLRDYYFLTFDNEACKDAFMKRMGFAIV